jgi:hypothetical protein
MKKKLKRIAVLGFVFLFLAYNAVVYMHARAFTHFTEGGRARSAPRT